MELSFLASIDIMGQSGEDYRQVKNGWITVCFEMLIFILALLML